MKKILLSACAILVASATFAQQANLAELSKESLTKGYSTMLVTPNFTPSSAAVSPVTVWSDDCSSAATWVFTNTSALNIDWAIETDPNTIPVSVLAPMASASASNGFMFISSDANNTVDNDGTPIVAEFTTANSIDCSLYPSVQLSFSHNFRWWNDTRGVRVSGDNGATWTDFEITNQTSYSTPNQNSDNPHLSVYDISAIAGGQSQVLVQFYYNDHDIWAWYWAVDDVMISEIPDNAIRIENAITGGYWVDYQNYSASGLTTIIGLDYSVTPVAQVAVRPFSCEAVIRNIGSASQSAVLKYDVTGMATYSGVSVATVLAGSDSVIVAATPTFSPGVGTYTVEMWAEADSAGAGLVTTLSAVETRNIEVSQYLYGKDLGAANQAGARDIGDIDDANEITTRFEIYANADLTSLRVFIDADATVGAKIYAVIYEADSTASNGLFPLVESDDYTLTAQDINNWVDVPFISPIPLFAGYAYEFGVGGYQHPTEISRVGMTANTSLYNGEHTLLDKPGLSIDASTGQPYGVPTYFYITSTPMVRMNFGPATAIAEVHTSIFDVYPNPSLGSFTIALEEAGEFTVSVINVLGQTVYTADIDNSLTQVDLSGISKGMYTVELNSGDVVYTEKLIIE